MSEVTRGKARYNDKDVTSQVPMQATSYEIWDSKYRLRTKDGEPVDQDIDATYQRVAAPWQHKSKLVFLR